MDFKFSKYNHTVKYNGGYIVFNTLNLSLILLDQKLVDMLKENNIVSFLNSLTGDEVESLVENGILVEKDIDEIKLIKDAYWYNKYNDDTLHISILTTLDCNFACPYCFETRRNVRLTEKVEKSIIKFIKTQSVGKKTIHLDWYGGEPLLNIDSIERISKEIISYADQKGLNYYTSLTSNGYLLTDEILKRLLNIKIKSAQITLDGPKDVHDSMRPLANKQGTFDTIITNIKNASKHITINLRININQENYTRIDELLRSLVGIDNLCVAIKAIVPASYKEYNKNVLVAKDYANIVMKEYKYAQKLGIKTAIDKLFSGSMNRYCIVDSDSKFIVSPTRRLFKCGESYLDDEPGIIGEISEDEVLEINEKKKVFWDKDPFAFSECIDCKLLPLCFGGCQMKRNIKKVEPCSPEYKYSLDELIIRYYEMQIEQGE